MALPWGAAGAGMEPGWGGSRQVLDAGDGDGGPEDFGGGGREGAEKEELVGVFMWGGRALFVKGKKLLGFFFLLIFFFYLVLSE